MGGGICFLLLVKWNPLGGRGMVLSVSQRGKMSGFSNGCDEPPGCIKRGIFWVAEELSASQKELTGALCDVECALLILEPHFSEEMSTIQKMNDRDQIRCSNSRLVPSICQYCTVQSFFVRTESESNRHSIKMMKRGDRLAKKKKLLQEWRRTFKGFIIYRS